MKNLKMRAALAASLCLLVCVCLLLPGCEKRLERPLYPIVDGHHDWFTTKAEYDSYCKNNVLPKNFISYSQIQCLGEFFQFDNWGSLSAELSVEYRLTDQAGASVILSAREMSDRFLQTRFGHDYPIYKLRNSLMFNTVFSLPDIEDMLVFPNESGSEQYAYVRCPNELWYQYWDGKLYSVFWLYNDIVFSFESDSSEMALDLFCDYPDMTADTFTVKLLNVETAEQAIEELMRACFPDQEYTGLQRIKVPKFKN